MKFVVFTAALLCLASSIAIAGEKYPNSTPVTLTGTVPVFDTVPGYPWQQSKDGVTIQLLPVPMDPKVVYQRTLVQKAKGILSLSSGTASKYVVTETPLGYIYQPDTLSFQLHITNQLNRVLRFQGCVTAFAIDGRTLPFDPVAQQTLLSSVVLPQGTMDVTLKGPFVGRTSLSDSIKTILDTAKVVMFSIFDVTTEVDEAGNPTKKANFEWIFAIKSLPVNGTFQKTSTEQKLEAADAQRMHGEWWLK